MKRIRRIAMASSRKQYLSPDERYFLHILKNNKEIPEFLRKRTLEQKNEILLYPDPNDSSSSSTGACKYNACFIIQNTLLVDNNKLIEVSMGNLSLKEKTEHAERILQALNLLKDKKLPKVEIEIEEVGPYLPLVLTDIIFECAANVDPETHKRTQGYNFLNMPTKSQCAQLTLFGRPYLKMEETALMTKLGKMVLNGEENDVKTVLDEVRKKHELLDFVFTVEDPLGMPVTGTLLQIAVMAGDVNLKPDITNENDRGLVERLADAGGLSKERIAEDLACITSKEAQDANDKRVECYLAIIQKFGNSLCEGKMTNDKAIAQLEKELLEERCQAVNAGFIFDPRILHDTAKWFEENVNRFGGWWSPQSNVFWVNGFGKLQSLLSSRDAQVTQAGIGDVVDYGKMPERMLKNPSVDSHFYNASSKLGRDFYLGYFGPRGAVPGGPSDVRRLENLCQIKTTALHSLCSVQQAYAH